jgi:uncharacterized protein YbjT (DUF2867 family)
MYLVTGATGNVGRSIVAQLLDSGKRVRVLVRDPSKATAWHDRVQVAIGDFERPGSLVGAFTDIEAAFLLGTGPDVDSFRQLLATAKSESAPRIVYLSSVFVNTADIQIAHWHRQKEYAIREAGLQRTLIRPSGFMTNSYLWISTIKAELAVYSAMGAGKYAPIAPEDVAAIAVAALTDPTLTDELELTGSRLLSVPEQVDILAGALGKPLRCIDISTEMMAEALTRAGAPARLASAVAESHQAVREGRIASVSDTVHAVTGRHPKSFEVWTREHAAAFA